MSSRCSSLTRRSAASKTGAGIDAGAPVPSGSRRSRSALSSTPVTVLSSRRSVRDTSAVCLMASFEGRSRVDLSFTPEEEEFRTELRSYLESTLPAEWSSPGFWDSLDRYDAFEKRRQWEAEKAKAGFAGIAWPKEWGGRGGTEGMKAIYDEGRTRARAPRGANQLGLTYLAPTVAVLGTEQQ